MFPDWLKTLFFAFLAFLMICGSVVFVIVIIGIVRVLWDERKDERKKRL